MVRRDVREMSGTAHRKDPQRKSLQCGVDWRFTTADARVKLKHLYPEYQMEWTNKPLKDGSAIFLA
jgi:hypothetical protein